MKKKTKKIPQFKTREEEARFWETHSIVDFLNELKPVRPGTIIFAKHPKHIVTLHLGIEQLRVLRETLAHLTAVERNFAASSKKK